MAACPLCPFFTIRIEDVGAISHQGAGNIARSPAHPAVQCFRAVVANRDGTELCARTADAAHRTRSSIRSVGPSAPSRDQPAQAIALGRSVLHWPMASSMVHQARPSDADRRCATWAVVLLRKGETGPGSAQATATVSSIRSAFHLRASARCPRSPDRRRRFRMASSGCPRRCRCRLPRAMVNRVEHASRRSGVQHRSAANWARKYGWPELQRCPASGGFARGCRRGNHSRASRPIRSRPRARKAVPRGRGHRHSRRPAGATSRLASGTASSKSIASLCRQGM